MNEKLSQIIDNEFETENVTELVTLLGNDAYVREQWTVSHLIGDAIKGLVVADDGFSIRIFAALKNVHIDPHYDPLSEPQYGSEP